MDKPTTRLPKRSSFDARILHDAKKALQKTGILPKELRDEIRKSSNEMALRKAILQEASDLGCAAIEIGAKAPAQSQKQTTKNNIDVLVEVKTNKMMRGYEAVIFKNLSISELSLFNENLSKNEKWSVAAVGPAGTANEMEEEWILKEFQKAQNEMEARRGPFPVISLYHRHPIYLIKKSKNEYTNDSDVTYIPAERTAQMNKGKKTTLASTLTH